MKENGWPQLRQKPSVRPGRPPRLRPTFSSHLLQKRRFSGTSGFSMIAEAGSRAGTGGTSTSPAPSIPRLAEPLEPVPRVPPREAVRPDPTLPDPLVGALPYEDPCPLRPLWPDEPGGMPAGGAGAAGVVTGACPAAAGAEPGGRPYAPG
ncbi:hypothetical protein GCM10010402_27630 [Actinomadura luteofluorescens]